MALKSFVKDFLIATVLHLPTRINNFRPLAPYADIVQQSLILTFLVIDNSSIISKLEQMFQGSKLTLFSELC